MYCIACDKEETTNHHKVPRFVSKFFGKNKDGSSVVKICRTCHDFVELYLRELYALKRKELNILEDDICSIQFHAALWTKLKLYSYDEIAKYYSSLNEIALEKNQKRLLKKANKRKVKQKMSQKSAATQACRIGSQTWMRQKPDNPNGLLNIQNYKLCMSLSGMFLSDYNSFTLPSKLYGLSNIENITNRVLHTFHATNKNLGVLLSGLKGTGKSIQLKHIAQNSNMPVIIVDELFEGPQLLSFIDSLPQSCVIVFDEFEKVYADRAENNILSVLDGLSTSAHIFVLTVNGEVSEFMQSRPSRIRYLMNYSGLSQNTIKEILNDRLDPQAAHHMNDLMTYFECFDDINLDTVVSLISEVNLYPNDKFDNIVSIFNLPNPLDQDYEFHIPTVALVYDKDTPASVLSDVKQFIAKNGHMPYNYEYVMEDCFKESILFFEKVKANFPEYVSIVDIALTTTKKFTISEFKYNCEASHQMCFRESYSMSIPYTHKLLAGSLHLWIHPHCNEVTFKKIDRGSFSISLDDRECVIASRSFYKSYRD